VGGGTAGAPLQPSLLINDATQHEFGFFDVYVDRDGNFLKVIAHRNIDFVITANGKTLNERDNITTIITPEGSRDIGSWTHIQGNTASSCATPASSRSTPMTTSSTPAGHIASSSARRYAQP
jgi:hypothetical protein